MMIVRGRAYACPVRMLRHKGSRFGPGAIASTACPVDPVPPLSQIGQLVGLNKKFGSPTWSRHLRCYPDIRHLTLRILRHSCILYTNIIQHLSATPARTILRKHKHITHANRVHYSHPNLARLASPRFVPMFVHLLPISPRMLLLVDILPLLRLHPP